jgi:hypothetical protein
MDDLPQVKAHSLYLNLINVMGTTMQLDEAEALIARIQIVIAQQRYKMRNGTVTTEEPAQ